MIFLLDTTVLIDALRLRLNRRAMLAGLVEAGHTLATSAINVGEIFAGIREPEQARTEAFLADLICYPVTVSIARGAGWLVNAWARKGRSLSLADTLVAATALEHHLTLVTDNRKDFPMPELNLHSFP